VSYVEETRPGQTQSDQRPRLLQVDLSVPGTSRPLTVATTCLDWRDANNRAASLDTIFSLLTAHDDVVLLGDFNFDAQSEPETSHIDSDYIDVWSGLNPNAHGFTWDPIHNGYAKQSDPESLPSRIDRIFVKSTHWLPRLIKLVGCSSADPICLKADQEQTAKVTTAALLETSSAVRPHKIDTFKLPPLPVLPERFAAVPPRRSAATTTIHEVVPAIMPTLKHKQTAHTSFLQEQPTETTTTVEQHATNSATRVYTQPIDDRTTKTITTTTTTITPLTTPNADADDSSSSSAAPPSSSTDSTTPSTPASVIIGSDDVYPSNHYGLLAYLSLFTPHC